MDTIRIKVTQEHIQRGLRNSACSCPIALAMAEHFGDDLDHNDNVVGCGFITHYEHGTGKRTSWWAPPEVERFIDKFDGGGAVSPFEFELRPERIRKSSWPQGEVKP